MDRNEWNSLDSQQQDFWFLTIEQLDSIIMHINTIILSRTEELTLELDQMEQEKDEAMDSAAEKPLQEIKEEMYKVNQTYIAALMALLAILQKYRDNMTDVFQVKDINRQLYLDYLGLDEWINKIEEDLGIDSEYINSIINDDPKLKSWEIETEAKFKDQIDMFDGGSGFLGSDRQEELKYEQAKRYYQEARYELQVSLKFQDEVDFIIKNVAKTKGIKEIEEGFVLEEIIDMLGSYTRYVDKVDIAYLGVKSIENEIESSELLDILKHFKKGDKLVVNSGKISDEILQNLKNDEFLKKLSKSGFFKIENESGIYKISMMYDDITKWARENTNILDNILDNALKKGIRGIYKFDNKSGKWYTLDEYGKKKYFTELPENYSKFLEGANKILKPTGYAINILSMYDAWKSHSITEMGETAGSIIGGTIGAEIALAFLTDGVSIFLYIVAAMGGGYVGSKIGGEIGAEVGGMFEEDTVYWESNE